MLIFYLLKNNEENARINKKQKSEKNDNRKVEIKEEGKGQQK